MGTIETELSYFCEKPHFALFSQNKIVFYAPQASSRSLPFWEREILSLTILTSDNDWL